MYSQTVFVLCAVFSAQAFNLVDYNSDCGCSGLSGLDVVGPLAGESVYPIGGCAGSPLGISPFGDSVLSSYSQSLPVVPITRDTPVSNLPVLRAPSIVVNRPATPTIEIPAPPAPRPCVIANDCLCKKTIVRPQYIQRRVQEQGVQRYVKTSYQPVVDRIPYSGTPVSGNSYGLGSNVYPAGLDVVGNLPLGLDTIGSYGNLPAGLNLGSSYPIGDSCSCGLGGVGLGSVVPTSTCL